MTLLLRGEKMISETILSLPSLAPLIYASTVAVVLLFVIQSFGFDVSKYFQALFQRLMIRSKVSRTGA